MTVVDAPADGGRLPEEVLVFRWRRDRFRELGYDGVTAARLALDDVDYHDVERLLSRGCPIELAPDLAPSHNCAT